MEVPQKLKIESLSDPAIPLLDTYPDKCEKTDTVYCETTYKAKTRDSFSVHQQMNGKEDSIPWNVSHKMNE